MAENVKEVELTVGKVLKIVFLIGFLIVGLVLLLSSFYTVKAGERGVILEFGEAQTVPASEGLHFKVPVRDEIVKVDVKTQKYETDSSAASKDLQIVTAKIAINYHLVPETVPQLFKEIGLAYNERVIQPAVQEVVKASTAQFTAEELITRRAEVKDKIKQGLVDRLQARGIIVEDVSIVNFDFSPEFNKAIESKVTNEQNALAEKNKVAQIEYIAQQKIAEAEGIKQAAILDAQGKAESIKIQSESIKAQGGKEYIQLQSIQKWDGKLPQYMTGGSPIPFIDVNNLATK